MRITKDPEVRRQEIIDVALRLFEGQGIPRTSMGEIAREAKVAKGLLYYYFDSKEALVEAVLEEFLLAHDTQLKALVEDPTRDFYGKLSGILTLYFVTIQNHPGFMAFSPGNPGVFELLKTRLSASALRETQDLIEAAKEKGQLSIEYPDLVLRILISGIADLYLEGVTDPAIFAVLIEQSLGLPKGALKL